MLECCVWKLFTHVCEESEFLLYYQKMKLHFKSQGLHWHTKIDENRSQRVSDHGVWQTFWLISLGIAHHPKFFGP